MRYEFASELSGFGVAGYIVVVRWRSDECRSLQNRFDEVAHLQESDALVQESIDGYLVGGVQRAWHVAAASHGFEC